MPLAAVLVNSTPYRLRYLLTNTSPLGAALTIPNDNGVTPDLRTDLAGDPSSALRQVMFAGVNGIGTVAAGALTQANARDILLGDELGTVGNDLVPRAMCTISPRTGPAQGWAVDVNVDGQFDPVVLITAQVGVAVGATAYLDIWFRSSEYR
ncbi:hypothetical protein LCGC14_1112650 [marine sediment metagenome]|uniref:Uncharacterized protein n=1 Tax=marine sediment metagenome TaxID=412755 RepID=A0A0F9PPD8_9ZZZZ